jgi:hypothetical protein
MIPSFAKLGARLPVRNIGKPETKSLSAGRKPPLERLQIGTFGNGLVILVLQKVKGSYSKGKTASQPAQATMVVYEICSKRSREKRGLASLRAFAFEAKPAGGTGQRTP